MLSMEKLYSIYTRVSMVRNCEKPLSEVPLNKASTWMDTHSGTQLSKNPPLLLRAQKGLSISENFKQFLRQVDSTCSVHLTATWRGKVDLIRDSTLWEDLAMSNS